MIVRLDEKAVEAVNEILRRGNKAVIQRQGDGVIVMEEKRKIQYSTAPKGSK